MLFPCLWPLMDSSLVSTQISHLRGTHSVNLITCPVSSLATFLHSPNTATVQSRWMWCHFTSIAFSSKHLPSHLVKYLLSFKIIDRYDFFPEAFIEPLTLSLSFWFCAFFHRICYMVLCLPTVLCISESPDDVSGQDLVLLITPFPVLAMAFGMWYGIFQVRFWWPFKVMIALISIIEP